jgi:hypothetical protein
MSRTARLYFSIAFFLMLMVSACGQDRGRVPSEVLEVVTHIGNLIAQERYDQIYAESSETLRTKLGKVETRSLNSAAEQENSGGVLKGHVFILSYETRFERGEGMETFTLIEENGQWRLARYLVNSTALK